MQMVSWILDISFHGYMNVTTHTNSMFIFLIIDLYDYGISEKTHAAASRWYWLIDSYVLEASAVA